MDEMQEYAKTIKIDRHADDPSDSPFFALQHWYPRVWDEWARDKDGAVASDIYGTEEDSLEIADTKELRYPNWLPPTQLCCKIRLSWRTPLR